MVGLQMLFNCLSQDPTAYEHIKNRKSFGMGLLII